MPNRILRDWTDSFKFDGLSANAEVLFTRLIMKADDFGRYNAHPQLIKSGCFPLTDALRANTISAWLTELSDRKLIFSYTAGNRPLLAIINFGQRIRDDALPKFAPPEGMPERWLAVDDDPARRIPPHPAAPSGLGVGVVGAGGEADNGGVGGDPPARDQALPEVPTVEQAVAQTMAVGIPEDFARYVFDDWQTRGGKDAGGVPVRWLGYVTKRWNRERTEWTDGNHKGKKHANSGKNNPNRVDRNTGTANEGDGSEYANLKQINGRVVKVSDAPRPAA